MGACLPPDTRRVLDLGSGGGIPGLVLAQTHPGLQLVLLDATARRSRFLAEAVADLGLGERVEVAEARAESAARDPAWREAFDAVVARSFGPPGVTAECAVGFLRLGGWLIISEPPEAGGSRWPAEGLDELGFGPVSFQEVAGFGFARVEKTRRDDRWPRRVGIPSKRPRF